MTVSELPIVCKILSRCTQDSSSNGWLLLKFSELLVSEIQLLCVLQRLYASGKGTEKLASQTVKSICLDRNW